MSSNPLYQKWKNTQTTDDNFLGSLQELKNSQDAMNSAFSKGIRFFNKKIVAKIGAGTNLINEYTITNIAQSFIKGIQKANNINIADTNGILIFDDNSYNSRLYSNIIARVFSQAKIKTHFVNQSEDLPFTMVNYMIDKNNLFGAICISKMPNTKEILQIDFFKKDGYQLNTKEILAINFAMNQTNYLSLDLPHEIVSYRTHQIQNQYLHQVMNDAEYDKINHDIKFTVDFSHHQSRNFYSTILEKMKLKHSVVERKLFKSKSNVNNAKSLNNALLKAKTNKSEVAFVIGHNDRNINIAIKHRHHFRYLSNGEVASLFLIYQNLIKQKKYSICKSYKVGGLVQEIAKKFNYDYVEYDDSDNKIPNNDYDLLVSTNQKYYCRSFGYAEYDAFLFMLNFLKIYSFFQQNKLKIVEILEKKEKELLFYHSAYRSEFISHDMAHRFFKRLKSLDRIADKKVLKFEDIAIRSTDANNKIVRVKLENNVDLIYTYSVISQTLSTNLNIKSIKNQSIDEMMAVERDVLDSASDYKENVEFRKPSAFSYVKYFFYFSLLVGVFLFLFMSVWKLDNTASNNGTWILFNNINRMIFQSQLTRWTFISILLLNIFNVIVSGILTMRTMNYQGHKIKLRHTIIASFLGIVVQNITPKSIGGEIAFYWYLRRKGYDKPALLASTVASGVVWQISNFLMTLIFVPVGMFIFRDKFSTMNAETITFIVFLVLGLVTDTGVAVFVFIVSLSKKTQKFIVTKTISLFQWFPLTNVYDERTKIAKYIYDFAQVRNGILIVFNKWWKVLELIFYRFTPWMISGIAFFLISFHFNGQSILNNNLSGGTYINVISALSLSRIANAVSITPGGSGSYEAFAKSLFTTLFRDDLPGNTANNWAVYTTAINSLGTLIIPTAISAILFVNIWVGEKLLDKKQKQQKNRQLINNSETTIIPVKSLFYRISTALWAIGTIVGLLIFLTI